MRIDEQEHLNKFEIAIAHEQLSSVDFLRTLLKTKDLGVSKADRTRIFLWIREMLRKIRDYIPYVFWSHTKARFGADAEVSRDAYDYTRTDEFHTKEDTLFWMLGMDRRFLDHDLIKQYRALEAMLIDKYGDPEKVKEVLKDVSLSNRGLFLLKGNELAVVEKEAYENYREFALAQAKEGKEYDQSLEMNKGDYFVIPTDTELYKEYEKHLSDIVREKAKEMEPKVEKPAPEVQKTNTEEKKPEPKTEEVQEPANTGYTDIKKSEEWAQQQRIAKIAAETPEKLNGICCKITVVNTKIAKFSKDSVFITMPKAKNVGKNTWYKSPFDLHDKVLELPSSFVKNKFKNGFEIAIPLNYKPKAYDAELKPIFDNDGVQVEIAAPDMLKCFAIKAIRELDVTVSDADIFIDGEPMKNIEFDHFKFAYGNDRAVVLGYDGKDEHVKIPENITVKGRTIPVTEIKDGAFKNNGAVKNLDIGKNVTEIRDCAFMGCKNLETVTMGECVKDVGNGVFKNCEKLTDVTLPGTIESIGSNIYEGCTAIKDLHVSSGEGLIKEFKGVLYKGTELYSYPAGRGDATFKVPKGTTAIGENAFVGCRVADVAMPDSVSKIKFSAFAGCGNLSRVCFDNEEMVVGDRAFYGSSIADIDLYKIKDLGSEALDNTPKQLMACTEYSQEADYSDYHGQDIPEIHVDEGFFYGELSDSEVQGEKIEIESEQKPANLADLLPDMDF